MNTIIEKIRAEIERLKKTDGVCQNNNETADVYYSRGAKFVCDDHLSFLSDLEKECEEKPTTAEGLEEDVKSWFFNEISSKINVEHTMYYYFQECARRYYELGRQSNPKVSEELEEAARHSEILTYPMPEDGDIDKVMKVQEVRIFHEIGFKAGAEWHKEQMISALKNDGDLPIEFIDKFHEIDRNAFQNGQENMREQMMKGAKDGYVSAIIIHNDGDEEHYAVTYPNGERLHSITDKVKIIIL